MGQRAWNQVDEFDFKALMTGFLLFREADARVDYAKAVVSRAAAAHCLIVLFESELSGCW